MYSSCFYCFRRNVVLIAHNFAVDIYSSHTDVGPDWGAGAGFNLSCSPGEHARAGDSGCQGELQSLGIIGLLSGGGLDLWSGYSVSDYSYYFCS